MSALRRSPAARRPPAAQPPGMGTVGGGHPQGDQCERDRQHGQQRVRRQGTATCPRTLPTKMNQSRQYSTSGRMRALRACLSRVPRRVARTVLRGPRRRKASGLPDRDIRMAKLRQKVSGGLRALTGAHQFCRIRSYLGTATKHDHRHIDALITLAQGNLWQPAAP